jgi:hypothetical protein
MTISLSLSLFKFESDGISLCGIVIFICKIISVGAIERKRGVLKRASAVDQFNRLELLEDGCTSGGGMEG